MTQQELAGCADFGPDAYTFTLHKLPEGIEPAGIPLGRYRLVTHKNGIEDHHYRLGHPLAERLLTQAKARPLPPMEVTFQYSQHGSKISLVERLQNRSGWLCLSLLTVEALEQEEHLILSGVTDDGEALDSESCAKLFGVTGWADRNLELPVTVQSTLQTGIEASIGAVVQEVAERNHRYFETEMEKLETWADDLKQGLERELKELDKEIKEIKKQARQLADLDSKVAFHKKAKDLEKKRNDKRRGLFDAQDEIDTRKETLITDIEARLKQQLNRAEIFTIRWRVV